MFINAQVVMLPTNKSVLAIKTSNNKLEIAEQNASFIDGIGYTPQHITFISDEKPKAEQWVFCMDVHLNNPNHPPDKYINPVRKRGAEDNCNACKPIIASTDPSLGLPAIPSTWIRDVYVPSNGSIKEVMLETYRHVENVEVVNGVAPIYSDRLKLTKKKEVVIVESDSDKGYKKFLNNPEEYIEKTRSSKITTVTSFNDLPSEILDDLREEALGRGDSMDSYAIEFSKWWFNNGFTYNRKENHWRKYPSEKKFTDKEMIEIWQQTKNK